MKSVSNSLSRNKSDFGDYSSQSIIENKSLSEPNTPRNIDSPNESISKDSEFFDIPKTDKNNQK